MKITVWMTAYNHEDYIEACLDGILKQNTKFEFDIVLGEDFSTDRTREIIIDYDKKHPGRFKLFLPENNIGMMEMDSATFPMCTGEYIALLNGDDYWTDEFKLQKQSDLLDSDPGISMCYHKTKVIDEINDMTWETEFTGEGNILPVEKLFRGFNPIMTSSVMCRNFEALPEWYNEMPYGDMPLYLMLSERGKISYIDETMGVYRIHNSGNWQGDSLFKNLLKDIHYYRLIDEKFNYKYNAHIKKILAHRFFDLIIISLKDNDKSQAEKYYTELESTGLKNLSAREKDVSLLHDVIFNNNEKSGYTELLNKQVSWHIS